MQSLVWIETVIAGTSVAVHRVATVERNDVNAPADLGLTLEDGKTILNGIEQCGCQQIVSYWQPMMSQVGNSPLWLMMAGRCAPSCCDISQISRFRGDL